MAVRIYGRWTFLVDSSSRPGMCHLVDWEPQLDDFGSIDKKVDYPKCGCEAWALLVMRPCKHILETIDFIADSARLTKHERIELRSALERYAKTGIYIRPEERREGKDRARNRRKAPENNRTGLESLEDSAKPKGRLYILDSLKGSAGIWTFNGDGKAAKGSSPRVRSKKRNA
jgi:hypothetical protein